MVPLGVMRPYSSCTVYIVLLPSTPEPVSVIVPVTRTGRVAPFGGQRVDGRALAPTVGGVLSATAVQRPSSVMSASVGSESSQSSMGGTLPQDSGGVADIPQL